MFAGWAVSAGFAIAGTPFTLPYIGAWVVSIVVGGVAGHVIGKRT